VLFGVERAVTLNWVEYGFEIAGCLCVCLTADVQHCTVPQTHGQFEPHTQSVGRFQHSRKELLDTPRAHLGCTIHSPLPAPFHKLPPALARRCLRWLRVTGSRSTSTPSSLNHVCVEPYGVALFCLLQLLRSLPSLKGNLRCQWCRPAWQCIRRGRGGHRRHAWWWAQQQWPRQELQAQLQQSTHRCDVQLVCGTD
jgi:hypothetical protein